MMNSYLDRQIRFYFGKSFDEMNEEEKTQITEITLPYKDFNGNVTGVSIAELSKFPNLKKCLISGFEITDDDIEVLRELSTLRGIQFSGCDFSEVKTNLGELELVVIDGCRNIPKSMLQANPKLRLFRATNQNFFDVECLKGCVSLEEVYLQRSTLVNLLELMNLRGIRLVNLNGSKMNFLAFTHLSKNINAKVEYEKDGPPDFTR